jgi:hypothetical protein
MPLAEWQANSAHGCSAKAQISFITIPETLLSPFETFGQVVITG